MTIFRFLVSGASSTLFSSILVQYLIFSNFLNFAIAYLAGLILSYLLNSKYVFNVNLKFNSFLKFCMLHFFLLMVGSSIYSVLSYFLPAVAKTVIYLLSILPVAAVSFFIQRNVIFLKIEN
mgnify:CR=1 FL=1